MGIHENATTKHKINKTVRSLLAISVFLSLDTVLLDLKTEEPVYLFGLLNLLTILPFNDDVVDVINTCYAASDWIFEIYV